ncbi:MAG: quinone oxidoreductase [Actinomyces sp.]|nr:MAG: quinone oxidoreductase [Actinomyces sp.]
MQAIEITSTGGPEVLRLVERPDPEPGPGELLVEVAAAGVNFIDTYQRSGLYEVALPFVPGLEAAGTVVALGPGAEASGIAVGDRVAWCGVPGAYATVAVVPADRVVTVPDGIGPDVAAAVMLQGMTAHYLTHDTFPVGPGHVCVVPAAAGGTGRLIVQLARRRGATVIGAVGSAAKVDIAAGAGAHHVVDLSATGLAEGVEALVGRDAVDVVYDGVGAATFEDDLRLLRIRGMLVTFGNASGPVPPVPPLRLSAKSLYLTRPTLFHYIAGRDELVARADDLFAAVGAGEVEVLIGERHPLADAAEAHRRLEGRATVGKILLIP